MAHFFFFLIEKFFGSLKTITKLFKKPKILFKETKFWLFKKLNFDSLKSVFDSLKSFIRPYPGVPVPAPDHTRDVTVVAVDPYSLPGPW